MDDPDDRDDLEDRLSRLETTLEELRAAVAADDRVDAGRRAVGPAATTARRLTERVAVPAAVAALEANVRLLTYLQERLRAYEAREPGGEGVGAVALDRIDGVLADLEAAIADADLPADAEARRLLQRARDLNDEVRERAATRDGEPAGASDDGPTVIEIDVEEELDAIRDEVADEDDES